MLLALCMSSNVGYYFYEVLNGLKVLERTQFCHRNCYLQRLKKHNSNNIYIQELWFLRSARRLMLINISMKFHEDILNVF